MPGAFCILLRHVEAGAASVTCVEGVIKSKQLLSLRENCPVDADVFLFTPRLCAIDEYVMNQPGDIHILLDTPYVDFQIPFLSSHHDIRVRWLHSPDCRPEFLGIPDVHEFISHGQGQYSVPGGKIHHTLIDIDRGYGADDFPALEFGKVFSDH